MKLEVGQKVYLKPAGNNARRANPQIGEFEIKKIGRKYFEVGKDERSTIKFHIEGNHKQVTDYTPDWDLYFSKEEILDEKEFVSLQNEIEKIFRGYGKVNLTLDQLRKIKEIINQIN